jgi:hypothetical protein
MPVSTKKWAISTLVVLTIAVAALLLLTFTDFP